MVELNRSAFPELTLNNVMLGSNPDIELVSKAPVVFNAETGKVQAATSKGVAFGKRVSSGLSCSATLRTGTISSNQCVLFGIIVMRFSGWGIGFFYGKNGINGTGVRSGSGNTAETPLVVWAWDAQLATVTLKNGVSYGFAVRYQAGNTALFIDGVKVATSTSGNNPGISPDLVRTDTTLLEVIGSASGVNVSDNTLSRLSANPWQLFQPIRTPIFVPSYTQIPETTIPGFKFWDGSQWVEKPIKVWTGSEWKTGVMKRWTGNSWE